MVTKFVLNIIETIISVCVSLVRCECLHVWAGVCYSSCLCLHMFSLSLYCRCLVLSLRIEGMRFWRWFSRRNDLKSLTVGWTGLQSSSQVRSSRSMAFVRLLRAVPGEDRVGEGGSGDWGLGVVMPCWDGCSRLCVCPFRAFLWGNLGLPGHILLLSSISTFSNNVFRV